MFTLEGGVMPVLGRLLTIVTGVLAIDHGVVPVVAMSAVAVVIGQLRLDRLAHVPVRSCDVPHVSGSIALVGHVVQLLRALLDSLSC